MALSKITNVTLQGESKLRFIQILLLTFSTYPVENSFSNSIKYSFVLTNLLLV